MFVYGEMVSKPDEREAMEHQRQIDRDLFRDEVKVMREREDARMQRLWQRHQETLKAIADLTAEVKALRGK